MIVLIEISIALAADVEAERVLCAPNFFVSIPASSSTFFNHLLTVSAETALYGF
jgi:hypothetical protein